MKTGGRSGRKQVRKPRLSFELGELLDRLEVVYGRSRYINRFDPMEELVSCILSQNTADANSFPSFIRLRAAVPDWAEMELMPVEELELLIKKAGLAKQKARSIQAALGAIREKFGMYSLDDLRNWEVEQARDWLTTIPGVGPKTASIVLCFALGRDTVPVDTHIHRVGKRLGIFSEGMDANRAHEVMDLLVEPGQGFRIHNTLIQHGRQTCMAPIPNCAACVIRDDCRWFKRVGPEKLREQMRKKRTGGKRVSG
ncbi:MAG: endonuclease III [Armatimonadetes bacterium]|nr:endonuclease III [Armatimonadota bacterium]